MRTLLPDFSRATFNSDNSIDNRYFPLTPGQVLSYQGEKYEAEEIADEQADLFGTESNQVFVTYETKNISGVETFVVRDVAWDEGLLVEDTFDWYAQDTTGNVWYLGEIATNYEYDDEGNFISTNNEGSWEAGVDGALPGYIMEANPQIGDRYYQEFAPTIAEDEGKVISLNKSVSLDFGDFDNVLKIRDSSQLEPKVFEYKYYAPGVGEILAEEDITKKGEEPKITPELIGVSEIPNITLPALTTATFENSAEISNVYFPLNSGTRLIYKGKGINEDTGEKETEKNTVLITENTKDILGITSRVVNEKEFVNGLLREKTLSYYAQDTEGNVWLLGEKVTEYEYDQENNLIETDKGDSWLAGEGQSLPGLIMVGNPEVGQGYYERFDIGEEESQAEIISLDAAISDVDSYDNVLQIKEFSALESDEFDYEYYAPGIGKIFTEELNQNGEVIFTSSLTSVSDIG